MIFQRLDLQTNNHLLAKRPQTPSLHKTPSGSKRKSKKLFQRKNNRDYSFIDQCKRTFSAKVKESKPLALPLLSVEAVKPLELASSNLRYIRAYTPNEKLPEDSIKNPQKALRHRVSPPIKSSKKSSNSPLKHFKIDNLEGW